MLLEKMKIPFAALCIALSVSTYASAIPAELSAHHAVYASSQSLNEMPAQKFQPSLQGSSDDSDIKEARNEERPVRDSRPLKSARPK